MELSAGYNEDQPGLQAQQIIVSIQDLSTLSCPARINGISWITTKCNNKYQIL